MKRIVLTLAAVASVALLPSRVLADEDARFSKLRQSAKPLPGSLGAFLESYVGECRDPISETECKANAAAFRHKMSGQTFVMVVSEEAATMLQPAGYNSGSGEYTVQITPFFPANGYAITHGAPKKGDAQGNPQLPVFRVNGQAKEGWTSSHFQSLFARRGLRMEVVLTPQDVWSLPKSGGKTWGVKARVDGISVTDGRTGEQVALWMNRG